MRSLETLRGTSSAEKQVQLRKLLVMNSLVEVYACMIYRCYNLGIYDTTRFCHVNITYTVLSNLNKETQQVKSYQHMQCRRVAGHLPPC